MKYLWLVPLIFLLSACCNSSCDCNDHCSEIYLYQFDLSPGAYTLSDIDTLRILYKFEGHRYYDTTSRYLINGRYYPGNSCAPSNMLALEKNYPDSSGKILRVGVYKVFTAIDSFQVDGMDLIITKAGDKCCKCINHAERTFQLDSVKYFQNTLATTPVLVEPK